MRFLYVLSDCSSQQKVSAKVRTKVFSVNDSIFLFNDDVEDGSIKNNSKNNSKNNIKNKMHVELSVLSEKNQIFFI